MVKKKRAEVKKDTKTHGKSECLHTDIDAQDYDWDGDTIKNICVCKECGAKIIEEYTRTNSYVVDDDGKPTGDNW